MLALKGRELSLIIGRKKNIILQKKGNSERFQTREGFEALLAERYRNRERILGTKSHPSWQPARK